jgi:hypothetical protein
MASAFGVRPQLGNRAVQVRKGPLKQGRWRLKARHGWPRRCPGGPQPSCVHDQATIKSPKWRLDHGSDGVVRNRG